MGAFTPGMTMECSLSAFDWVCDYPGHERRYVIDSTRLRRELGRLPARADFAEGLAATIARYRDNKA